MIIFFLAAQIVAAQEEYVIYEGTQLNYKVNNQSGYSYVWNVLNGYDMNASLSSGEYNFITNPDDSEVTVKWNTAGLYFLTITKTGTEGCANKKALAVQVEPNNRSFEFNLTASSECFNKSNNSFSLPFKVNDNSGNALSSAYFPMTVEYSVNGTPYSKTITYDNQKLDIEESMITSLNPIQNNDIIVAVTNITDTKNVSIPNLSNATHTRTIFALPTIEFTEELRIKYHLENEEIIAYSGNTIEYNLRTKPE